MTEKVERRGEEARPPDRLTCVRTGRRVDPAEHTECPYCFGELGDVMQGERADFCDFEPGRDPVHFGFPPNRRRHETG